MPSRPARSETGPEPLVPGTARMCGPAAEVSGAPRTGPHPRLGTGVDETPATRAAVVTALPPRTCSAPPLPASVGALPLTPRSRDTFTCLCGAPGPRASFWYGAGEAVDAEQRGRVAGGMERLAPVAAELIPESKALARAGLSGLGLDRLAVAGARAPDPETAPACRPPRAARAVASRRAHASRGGGGGASRGSQVWVEMSCTVGIWKPSQGDLVGNRSSGTLYGGSFASHRVTDLRSDFSASGQERGGERGAIAGPVRRALERPCTRCPGPVKIRSSARVRLGVGESEAGPAPGVRTVRGHESEEHLTLTAHALRGGAASRCSKRDKSYSSLASPGNDTSPLQQHAPRPEQKKEKERRKMRLISAASVALFAALASADVVVRFSDTVMPFHAEVTVPLDGQPIFVADQLRGSSLDFSPNLYATEFSFFDNFENVACELFVNDPKARTQTYVLDKDHTCITLTPSTHQAVNVLRATIKTLSSRRIATDLASTGTSVDVGPGIISPVGRRERSATVRIEAGRTSRRGRVPPAGAEPNPGWGTSRAPRRRYVPSHHAPGPPDGEAELPYRRGRECSLLGLSGAGAGEH
ncbi:unnamed protein product [Diplocarpon coronariae]